MAANSDLLDKGRIHFSTEGRLLQELGERLVASADLAIIELIKNAYDADSPICRVSIPNDKTLEIEDEGHGMTLDEFKSKWMTIATSSKQAEQVSRRYKRRLTGAKGIGRFAVRYLGKSLKLYSIAFDAKFKSFTRLEADFAWENVDRLPTLEQFEIPFRLFRLPDQSTTGTSLQVSSLRNEVIERQRIRTEVLRIVSPLSGLERGRFQVEGREKEKDPGFTVDFLEGFVSGQLVDSNLARSILDNCWARLTIALDGDTLTFELTFNYSAVGTELYTFSVEYPNHITSGLYADIRFFPHRGGIFQGKGIDGRVAWSWVKENAGVGVVDHGFRIKPYGYEDDDWLNLDKDHSRSERGWRTSLMMTHFPMSAEQKKSPAVNPMLNIAVNLQLVGAVFVESRQRGVMDNSDLIPAMDREGFLSNEAFREMQEIVRTGLELLALKDKEEEIAREEKKVKAATKDLRTDLKSAIHEIEQNESIPRHEKTAIIETYGRLAKEIESVDEYHRTSRENLELVSLIGVVSGYMTHEAERILSELKSVGGELESLSKQYPQLRSKSERISSSLMELEGQIGYTAQFIRSIHSAQPSSFNARAQVEYVIEKFGGFAKRRSIEHIIEIDDSVETPSLHVAIYSGVLLNLYTNAVKAILMKKKDGTSGKIMIRAINQKEKHILEVLDNGIGVPESLRDRIWDPLFTTTSKLNSPLGTGMGLGLSLVKKVIGELSGSIRLVAPIKDYVTAFRVEYPLRPPKRS